MIEDAAQEQWCVHVCSPRANDGVTLFGQQRKQNRQKIIDFVIDWLTD